MHSAAGDQQGRSQCRAAQQADARAYGAGRERYGYGPQIQNELEEVSMTASFRRDVRVGTPDGAIGCYMAFPSRANGAALVVLQEIFGVNGYIRSLVNRFAD